MTEEEKNKWRLDWGGDLLLNHSTSNSRGTLIAFSKNLDYKLEKYETDNEGRIQICSIILKERKFLIINVYNENTEKEQVILLKKLDSLLEKFNENLDHEVILGGDFNFIMDKTLDAQGGTPLLKLSSIAEITKIAEKHDLCDIFRIRNPEKNATPLDSQHPED